MNKKIQTTLHISEKTRDAFKEIASAQKRDMSDVVEELMKTWAQEHSGEPRSDRAQMDHAISLLAQAVSSQLLRNMEWATEALIGAGLGLPGSTVFDRRISHFSAEKQELGKQFANWTLRRIIQYLDKGYRVALVCDSGTTIFWFLKAFGEAISEYFAANSSAHPLSELTVVTNNIPGAESFVTYASHHSVSLSSGRMRISDMVECRILAGTFLPEYVAITGKDTENDLLNYSKQIRGEHKKSILIGLTTGNWVSVDNGQVQFLARGRGHGAFKKMLVDISDEVYAITPLGKILLNTSPETLNRMLNFSKTAPSPQHQAYEPVPIPLRKAKLIKMVSTTRKGESVLRDHSALLRRELQNSATLEETNPSSAINLLKHMLFDFDKFSNEGREAQIEIEMPHAATRTEEFLRHIFSVRSQK